MKAEEEKLLRDARRIVRKIKVLTVQKNGAKDGSIEQAHLTDAIAVLTGDVMRILRALDRLGREPDQSARQSNPHGQERSP